ncbi:MAG TPA: hypothetical protein VMF08_14035 [Candidatus Sulfotelmatobacter sp.]|nr:hypothetical protein [Candidatus Sulfotelmatobacter sp.]
MPLLVIVLTLGLVGCQTAYEQRSNAAKEFNGRRNDLYESYLAADIDHARQYLLELAELGEAEKQISPDAQASHLTRAYGWLYVFEKRVGNEPLAEVYFEKAKYWRIREAELNGETDSEIGAELGTFTKEKVISDVDEWDKGASNGKGPNYLRLLKAH